MPPNLSHLTKPPLGLAPKRIWDENRLILINEAIERYLEADVEIPVEWIDERNQLLRNVKYDL